MWWRRNILKAFNWNVSSQGSFSTKIFLNNKNWKNIIIKTERWYPRYGRVDMHGVRFTEVKNKVKFSGKSRVAWNGLNSEHGFPCGSYTHQTCHTYRTPQDKLFCYYGFRISQQQMRNEQKTSCFGGTSLPIVVDFFEELEQICLRYYIPLVS